MTASVATDQPVLEAQGLCLGYGSPPKPILESFDLAARPGEIVALLGPSGVGKSSLLRILAGLQQPSRGRVRVNGVTLEGVHPCVTLAFQDPGLLPWLTAEKNVAFGLGFKRQAKLTSAERKARVDAALAEVGLEDARKLLPAKLSGGMAQRTALARCLARRPAVLLLDEPFGALDEVTRASMQSLLLRVADDFEPAIVMVTHDLDEALLVSDRVLLLGGQPARTIASWSLRTPKPREEASEEHARLRTEILGCLRDAMNRSDPRFV